MLRLVVNEDACWLILYHRYLTEKIDVDTSRSTITPQKANTNVAPHLCNKIIANIFTNAGIRPKWFEYYLLIHERRMYIYKYICVYI